MTYSIIVRDPDSGEMGVACQSQAFAVGSSVPWALPGSGVVATQSMGEPMYGELGLDALRAGLTASEALTALRSVDPHPERRQVAMVDGYGNADVYTGDACVGAAGHQIGEGCVALANMVASPEVWQSMVRTYEESEGTVAERLVAALHAAEAAGGDFRGRRSAAIVVVRAERTGRPWRDQLVDLRVDDHDDPVAELDRLVTYNQRYHRMVAAFELAIDGSADAGVSAMDDVAPDPASEPDLAMWQAIILALAERRDDARSVLAELAEVAPEFMEAVRGFDEVGLVHRAGMIEELLPGGPGGGGHER